MIAQNEINRLRALAADKPSQALEFNNAINFAIEQGLNCSDFLQAWHEGDTSEWPEFAAVKDDDGCRSFGVGRKGGKP